MKFRLKHFKNLLVRLFTKDTYYICEECHKIHKRDGNELRLDQGSGLIYNSWWYGSVHIECYKKLINHVQLLMKGSFATKEDELYYD
jgi:hypothetical protein